MSASNFADTAPQNSTTYTDVLAELRARDLGCAEMFKDAPSNPKQYFMRWNRSTNLLEEYNGSAWATEVLSVAGGGTGAANLTDAKTNLGIGTLGSLNTNSTVNLTGILTVDSPTFTVDISNNRVGVGTAGPATTLHISNSSETTPITLQRDSNTNGHGTGFNFKLGDSASATAAHGYAQLYAYIVDNTNTSEDGGIIINTSKDGTLTEAFRLDHKGHLGLGATPTVAKLEVKDSGMTHNGPVGWIRQDDDNVWGLVISNDTYSATATYGYRLTVEDDGDLSIYASDKTSAPAGLDIYTDETLRMNIDSAGRTFYSGAHAADVAQVTATNTTNADYTQGFHHLTPSMGTVHTTGLAVGREYASKNVATFGFYYAGDHSNSNFAFVGGHSNNDALKVFMDGSVEIPGQLTVGGGIVGALKSIQRGSGTPSGGSGGTVYTSDVTVSAVDMAKTFVICQGFMDYQHGGVAYLTSTTNVRTQARNPGGGGVNDTIHFVVVEYW